MRQRKFTLAVFFAAVGTIGLFTTKIGGGEFVGLAATILGMYNIANIGQRYVESEK